MVGWALPRTVRALHETAGEFESVITCSIAEVSVKISPWLEDGDVGRSGALEPRNEKGQWNDTKAKSLKGRREGSLGVPSDVREN
jgi:hypothetical protein